MIRACVAKADNGLDVMLNDVFLQKFRKGIVVVVKNNGMRLSGRIKIVVACIKVEFMYGFAGCFEGRAVSCRNVVLFFV